MRDTVKRHHSATLVALAAMAPAAGLVLAATACTTFGAPQSAEVVPGMSASWQMTVTTPVDDDPGWFWSYDCASDCGHVILAPELAFTWGVVEPDSRPLAVSAGINGVYPFVDFYAQLRQGDRPLGVGGRAGTAGSWHELRLYGRYDIPAGDNERILWNPGVLVLTGNSPNGANPGTFAALVQSFGVEARGDRFSATPAAAVVLGRGTRTSYGDRIGPFTTIFATLSVRLTLRRRPAG